MLIIMEECAGMPMPIMNAFQNTCTGGNNPILAVGNPDSELDVLYKSAFTTITAYSSLET
jgi:hypothetical protein